MRLAPAPAGSAAASIRLVLRARRLLTVGRCLSGLLDRAAGLEAAGDRHQPLGGNGVLVDLLDALHAEILHLRSVPVPQKTPPPTPGRDCLSQILTKCCQADALPLNGRSC